MRERVSLSMHVRIQATIYEWLHKKFGCFGHQPIKKCLGSFERVKTSASTDDNFTVDELRIALPQAKNKFQFFIDFLDNAMLPDQIVNIFLIEKRKLNQGSIASSSKSMKN